MTQMYQYFLQIKNTELFYHDFFKHNKILKFIMKPNIQDQEK